MAHAPAIQKRRRLGRRQRHPNIIPHRNNNQYTTLQYTKIRQWLLMSSVPKHQR